MNGYKKSKELEAKEAQIRALCSRGLLGEAAEKTLRWYGSEIAGWLFRRYRCKQTAADMYSNFSFYFWQWFPQFRWDSSLRTWLYRIARKVCYADLPKRMDPLSDMPEDLSALVIDGRARISTYKLPGVEKAYHFLSDRVLTQQERDLLIWRVNHGMKWQDIANILAEEPIEDDQRLLLATSKLRKQFERIKKRLRDEAEKENLIRRSDDIF